MDAFYKIYTQINFDESEGNESIAFIVVTDGETTRVGFPSNSNQENNTIILEAIARRLKAVASVDKVTDTKTEPNELFGAIAYNMSVSFSDEEEDPFSNIDDAIEAAGLYLLDPITDEKGKFYDPFVEIKEEELEEPVTAAAKTCPPATQDIALNLKNRKNAIDTAMYGPLNPDEPNEEYWQGLASEWKVDIETAKKQRCGNCAVFVVTTDMKNCIAQGIEQGGSSDTDAWDAIGTAELGYCEAFDFKCAASRTCRAWVTGGPLDDSKAKEQ